MSQALLEEFYAENPDLNEALGVLTEICNAIKANPEVDVAATGLNAKLDAALSRTFNCEHVYIDWLRAQVIVEAYTILGFMIAGMSDPDEIMRKYATTETKSGIQYKRKHGINMYITISSAIVATCNFEPRVVMSVILHEIGHNFFLEKRYVEMMRVSSIVAKFFLAVIGFIKRRRASKSSIWRWIFSSETETTDKQYEWTRDLPLAQKMLYTAIGAANLIGQAVFALPRLLAIVASYALNPEEYFLDYRAEKFSDNFATRYGYGPETADLESKLSRGFFMTNREKNAYDNDKRAGAHFVKTLEVVAEYIMCFFDPHPAADFRMVDQLAYLEKELTRRELPSELKTKIREDIAELTAIIKKREQIKKELGIYKVIERINLILFGMSTPDWREAFLNKKKVESLDQYRVAFDQLLAEQGVTFEELPSKTQRQGFFESKVSFEEEGVLPANYVELYTEESILEKIARWRRGKETPPVDTDPGLLKTLQSLSKDGVKIASDLKDTFSTTPPLPGEKGVMDKVVGVAADANQAADKIKASTENLADFGKVFTSPEIKGTLHQGENIAKSIENTSKNIDNAVQTLDIERNLTKLRELRDKTVATARRNAFILGSSSIIATAVANVAFYDQNTMISAANEYIKRSKGMMLLATARVNNLDDDLVPEGQKSKLRLLFGYLAEGLFLAATAALLGTVTAVVVANIWIGVIFTVALPFFMTWRKVVGDTDEISNRLSNEIVDLQRFVKGNEYTRLNKFQKEAINKMLVRMVDMHRRLG